MEKFYIVTEEANLRKEYFEYRENLKIINKVVKEFFLKHCIETTGYCAYDDCLYIEATEKDAEKFNKVLNKGYGNGLREFKKNSKINKDWIKTLQEKNLKILHEPYLGFYFNINGKFSTRLFNIDDIVYCSMNSVHDFKTPKGFTEVKASEFYKVIEDAEKK